MDGGVANNTPISHAIDLGAREIYVLSTGHACALERPPASALGMAVHALSLLTHNRLVTDIRLHRQDARLIVPAAHDARAFLDRVNVEPSPIRVRARVRNRARTSLTAHAAD